jgi:polysaccharide export outer membrane protein
MKPAVLAALAVLSLAAAAPVCAAPPAKTSLDVFTSVEAPDRTIPGAAVAQNYRLGPLDKISVNVFGQDKLSVEKVEVDASGLVVLPLIGTVQVGGRTAQEVSTEVASRLGDYLQSPHVAVTIEEAVSQRVTVTGAVVESGIYSLKGPTSLLQAVSMAKGPDQKVADLKQVAVFRVIDGQRNAAIFDLDAIRKGKGNDPEILGGDIIVVPTSASKSAWRELVAAMPGFGIFALFR